MDDDHDLRMGILRSALDSPYWKGFKWRGKVKSSGIERGTGYYVLFEGTLPLYVGKTADCFKNRLAGDSHPIRNELAGRVTHVYTIKAPIVAETVELLLEMKIGCTSNKQKYGNKCHHNYLEPCWQQLEHLRQHGSGSPHHLQQKAKALGLLRDFGMAQGSTRWTRLTELGQTATKQDLQDCIDEFFKESWPHPPVEEVDHHNGWVLSGGWA